MYEGPLEKIYSDIQSQVEEYMLKEEEKVIYKISQVVGYDIDKDELIKALQYDRNQYNKGYEDATKEILDKIYDTFNGIQCYDGTGYDIYCDIKEALKEVPDED